ncbi:MAG TPA: hypothetical protein VHT26_07580 [Trebonia sp.]|jgi:hypothetical protein|nr:hypothetical protein [Trebonia sp.]
MDEITAIHAEITRRIKMELDANEIDIARWGNQFPGDMGFRRQVELAHKSVGLVTAGNIVAAVIAELGSAPPADV